MTEPGAARAGADPACWRGTMSYALSWRAKWLMIGHRSRSPGQMAHGARHLLRCGRRWRDHRPGRDAGQRPPFDGVNVRQAISYAIDEQAIVDLALFGTGGVPATGTTIPASNYYGIERAALTLAETWRPLVPRWPRPTTPTASSSTCTSPARTTSCARRPR